MSPFPALPVGLQRRCDDVMADLTAALVTIQAIYLAANGRYWQGLVSHTTLPADGNEAVPDRGRRTTDCGSWDDMAVPLPDTMPLAVEVHVYDGPAGRGYVVIGRLEIARRVWQRAIGAGPEARSHDWQDATPSTLT